MAEMSAASRSIQGAETRPGGMRRARRREAALAYLFVLPTILGLLFFTLGPVAAGFALSFTRWTVFTPPEWVGLANYQTIATNALVQKVFGNTLYFTVAKVPLTTALALAIALLLAGGLRGVTFYRAIFFLPVISSTVAAALIWSWLYSPSFGIINHLLSLVGIQGPPWLGSTTWAMPAIIVMSVWKTFGTSMLLFIAGLQNIPSELIEAATIDGANRWQRFRHVVWPMLSPTTFFVVVITTIAAFQVFDQAYVMTEGGPANSTMVVGLYIYLNAFRFNNMGLAAALAYCLFVAILVVTLVQFRVQRRWTHYE
jgi:ABC-type sugar transport system permease subunit